MPQETNVPSARFLREQDGAPERVLKSRLIDLFERCPGVQRIYLVQIAYGDEVGVALCIRNSNGVDRGMVQDIGSIFASVFGAHEHLDILFLSEEQQASLDRVCLPFFSKPIGP